jgi:VWFA-related protein
MPGAVLTPSRRALVVATCLTAAGLRADPPPPTSFPVAAEVVRLDVTVVDRNGRPVTGLASSDFEVVERGRPRELVSFDSVLLRDSRPGERPDAPGFSRSTSYDPAEGRCFLLFFDDVHVTPVSSEMIRRQLVSFVESQLRDGDVVTVVAPEARIWWTARTSREHRELPAVLRRLQGHLVRDPFSGDSEKSHADWEAMRLVEYGSMTGAQVASRGPGVGASAADGTQVSAVRDPEMVYAIAQRRIRRTLAVLGEAVRSVAAFRGRKCVFLVSEGFIRAPRLQDEYDRVIETARSLNRAGARRSLGILPARDRARLAPGRAPRARARPASRYPSRRA